MGVKTNKVNAVLKEGESLKIENKSKEIKPIFHMVGTGQARQNKDNKAINFIIKLTKMSKPELFVIRTIKESIIDYNTVGEVHISTGMFNASELQKWKRGLPILKEKKLVCSTKRSHFMINPNALIPNQYVKALDIWDDINTSKVEINNEDVKADVLAEDIGEPYEGEIHGELA